VHVAWTSASREYESFVFWWPDDAIRDWAIRRQVAQKIPTNTNGEHGIWSLRPIQLESAGSTAGAASSWSAAASRAEMKFDEITWDVVNGSDVAAVPKA